MLSALPCNLLAGSRIQINYPYFIFFNPFSTKTELKFRSQIRLRYLPKEYQASGLVPLYEGVPRIPICVLMSTTT